MTKTFFATYDGDVLRLEEPLALPADTRVRVTIEVSESLPATSSSFIKTAQSMDLRGPADWASHFDEYLYGEADSDE